MKKLCVNYFLVLLFGLGVLTSCSKTEDLITPAPTIELVNAPDSEQEAGANIKFTIQAESTENIEEITILEKIGSTSKTVDGYPKTKDFLAKTTDLIVYDYTVPETTENIELTFKVKDKNGKEGSVSHEIIVSSAETELDAAAAFEWKRVGTTTATGLTDFGLSWTSNGDGTSAIVKKAADKLVILTTNDWTTITTKEALKAKVDAASDVADYRGVSAKTSGTYDDVIATKKGDTYFIINVKKGSVVTSGSTTITITGNYKK